MSKHRFGLFALLVSFLAGAVGVGGFVAAVEYTNRTEFCISCHEMEQTVYQEYLASPHYKSASGTGAGCADCHVPREWPAKIVRKVRATGELYHAFLGTIDTPEKFAEHRLEMAQAVASRRGEDGAGDGEGHDLHRVPQGHRPRVAGGLRRRRLACRDLFLLSVSAVFQHPPSWGRPASMIASTECA
jgi:nitrate/TMAO reductase-like tetraheme cytochrome c subunit